MKQIMIHAYTRHNFGDDLLIHTLCVRYPETTFILHAPKVYKTTFQQLKNFRVQPSDTLFAKGTRYILNALHLMPVYVRWMARNCDAVVHIGGSLFIQQANWEKNIKATKAMPIKRKPFFLLGANFGPFADEAFYQQHKALFQTYSDICFREKYSFDLFKDLKNVRLADDIVFQLEQREAPKQEKTIVISVIKPSIRENLAEYDALYYKKMQEVTIYFIEKGYHVLLMSFCEEEEDNEAVEEIVQGIPAVYMEHIGKHFYQTNIEATLQIIARSHLVVATRFHAMIVGWVFHKPVFPIAYSEKMIHVLEDINFKGKYGTFAHLETLQPEIILHTEAIDVTKQIRNATKQFRQLDVFLKG